MELTNINRTPLPARLEAFVRRVTRADLWPIELERPDIFCPLADAPRVSGGRICSAQQAAFHVERTASESGLVVELVGVPAARIIGVLLADLPPPLRRAARFSEPISLEQVRPVIVYVVEVIDNSRARFQVPGSEQTILEQALLHHHRWLLQLDRQTP